MADEFDPFKNTTSTSSTDAIKKSTESVTKKVDEDVDLLDFNIDSNSEKQKPTDVQHSKKSREQLNTTDSIYDRLDVKKYSAKISMRSADEKLSSNVAAKSARSDDPSEIDRESNNYEYSTAPAQGGLIGTLNRMVRRFPALSLFYTPPAETASALHYAYGQGGDEFIEDTDLVDDDGEVPQLVDLNEAARELTAEEIALVQRYSDSSRTRVIALQKKEKTKPVDVAIHHETCTIHLCDIGRSLIEIYNFDGSLQHVIDDPIITNLEPSAIAVIDDGTIIVSSSSHHRLHLYAPTTLVKENQNKNEANDEEEFYYQQFKLGSHGTKLHQFQDPAGIAVDPSDGYLYICDQGNYRIQVMRPEGICERVIELIVNGKETYTCAPIHIAHQKNTNSFVCLLAGGESICFVPRDAEGPVEVDPCYITDNDEIGLCDATSVAIDDQDRIFISDTGNHRIVICSPEGFYLGHFGSEGEQPGQFKFPAGLAFTQDGTLVVADEGNQRIQLCGLIKEDLSTDKSKNSTQSELNSKEEKQS